MTDDTAALAQEALAQENERLQAENNSLRNSVDAVRAEYLQPYMNATSRIIELEAECDAIRNELHKIASFIEPHWQGAGAKLEADWIIRVIGEMNSEADAARAQLNTCEENREKWITAIRVITFEECAAKAIFRGRKMCGEF